MNKPITIFLLLMILIASCCTEHTDQINQFLKTLDGNVTIKVNRYDGNVIEKSFVLEKSKIITDDHSEWDIKTKTLTDKNNPDALEIEVQFELKEGSMESSGVAIEFNFSNWDTQNYIMAPAAVYNGNRFKVLPVSYPPYIYDAKDKPLDMPVTITNVPHLNIDGTPAKIEMLTSNCATPMLSFYNKAAGRGFIMLTTQDTNLGNSGLTIVENPEAGSASFVLTAPGIREKQYVMTDLISSDDKAPQLEKGALITLRLRVYNFEAFDMQAFYDKIFEVRKDLSGQNEYRNIAPFSNISSTILDHHDKTKWFENGKFAYICNGPGSDSPFGHIQIGWSGIPVYAFPQVIVETSERTKRVCKSLDAITYMQVKTGLFYGMFKKGELFGDNFDEMAINRSIVMMRRNGLAIYYGLQELELMRLHGHGNLIKPVWEEMFRKASDALVNVWKQYGQFGQFIDAETGIMEINNSTGGAINIAALAFASQYFKNPEYLKVAEAAGDFYFQRDLNHGYAGGGPAEILQCPDSESAAELAESYVVLYELTKEKKWLEMTKFATTLFSTWVVSYDYKFPTGCDLERIGANVTGSVWASVQNEHSAPGIYILSGDFMLKLFRATGDMRYAELLKDIVHNVVQYVTTEDNPLGRGSVPGSVSERVNLSDWEGKNSIGMVGAGDSNMAWETVALLSILQNPGIYIQTDTKKCIVFDHVLANITDSHADGLTLEIENPTKHDAQVSILAETSDKSKNPLGWYGFTKWPKIPVKAGEKIKVTVNRQGEVALQ